MEENNSKSCSTKSCGFSFCGFLKAGFIAAILVHILMIFQGNNSFLYFGKLFLGADVDIRFIYTVGVLVAVIFGIIFAFFYAAIIAPCRLVSDLIKAIVFAILLTAASYYGFPKLPQLANWVTGHSESSAIAVESNSEMASTAVAAAEPFAQSKANTQKIIVTTFTNSLIFALMVVVLYRRRHCKMEKTVKN